ncbi:hypothetical protein DICPUDRAFT_80796 [Dictyostelium purpureum]|uniref:Uncharacterized protein n=1 Tax=Dictyostelium purpureum TaxID=5786 RepID=F0ZRK1_DICPU|nr:uncharacterized protein DICPUDRAFT_80796 [Dictyostelium purpureum]EGC33433.1 hypothetical protein DICPUDRAFT_80796 [Dictyostelium purpureum]|eukprot:XP_003290052.1 hypothetical protein DICPUDRAFT_80796 [Dictyostelium purpureum]
MEYSLNGNIRTIELKVIEEKYFSDEVQWAITSLINDRDYRLFISQLNKILNDNRLLYVSLFLFVISFLFFGLFMGLSILLGWLLLVNFILLSFYFFYRYQKYNSYSRYILMQERINKINKKKSKEGIPINFCLLLRKKEEINFYSGVSVDISLIISYTEYEANIPDSLQQPFENSQPQRTLEEKQMEGNGYKAINSDSGFCIPLDLNDNEKTDNNTISTIQLHDGLNQV